MVTNWGCNYTEMMTLTCSFCLFKLGLNHVIWSASFSFNLKEEDAESIMVQQFSLHKFLQAEFPNNCLKIWDFLSVTNCSLILVGKWHLFSLIQPDWRPAKTNWYTTKDFRPLGKQSLLENKLPVLKGEKTIFILEFLETFLDEPLISFLVLLENKPI